MNNCKKKNNPLKIYSPKKIVREAMYGYNDSIDTFQRIIARHTLFTSLLLFSNISAYQF